MWAGAYHKCDQQRLRGACACVQSRLGLAAHLPKVLKWIKTKAEKNLDVDLRTVLLSMRTSILYEFYGYLSSPKREPTKRLNTMDHHTYAQTHKVIRLQRSGIDTIKIDFCMFQHRALHWAVNETSQFMRLWYLCECSDEPAHPHSLARGITARIHIKGL